MPVAALPLAPGAMLGVLGGGQLARMFAMAAHRLGYRVMALDPDPACPAAGACDHFICAPLDDAAAWDRLAGSCAAVTIETENVPATALQVISAKVRVTPDAGAVGIAQDRLAEKAFCIRHGIAVAPHQRIDARTAPEDVSPALLPGILKVSRNGYDGKGQAAVSDLAGLQAARAAMGPGPWVLEARVPLAGELSVILARNDQGQTAVFPVPLNSHRDGILETSVIPAPLPDAVLEQARTIAVRLADALDYRGVLCVEFFLLADGRLLVNEMAPRPHNSGHFSIDACVCSQFEQQVRVLAGLPLGNPRLLQPAAMVNLLGDVWQQGEPRWAHLLADPDVRLHLYGKRAARPGRKMGHLTVLGEAASQANRRLLALRDTLAGTAGKSCRATAPGTGSRAA